MYAKKIRLGGGINDADYPIQTLVNGKTVNCKYYSRWSGILERAYNPKYHKLQKTYENVSICDEWLRFSNFKKWMEKQDWRGKQLDKDIIKPGNQIYAPEYCCFVSSQVNGALIKSETRKGDCPTGVHYNKARKTYTALLRKAGGKQKNLGSFKDVAEAHSAYVEAKSTYLIELAHEQTDPRIAQGLEAHAKLLTSEET